MAEADADGRVATWFIYGSDVNVPTCMVKYSGGVGTTYTLVTDQRGSIRLVVNVATGALAQRIDYDEFGRVTADTNPGFQPFGYAGGRAGEGQRDHRALRGDADR